MPGAKLEIKIGTVTFSGEGAEDWLGQQLDKFLQRLPGLAQAGSEELRSPDSHSAGKPHNVSERHASGQGKVSLVAFVRDKKATSNQSRKFLATALWLHDNAGKGRLITKEITEALNTHNQGKLTNAAQCLINNIKAGYIVRDGKQFYVADEGRTELNQ